MASCRALAALGLLAALAAPAARAESLYLHALPVTLAQPLATADVPLRLALHVQRPERLAEQLGDPSAVVRDDALLLVLRGAPTLPGDPAQRHLDASFVVDWNEPAVAKLHAELVARHGAQPSLDALREFTAGAIPRKTYEHGWETASAVAGGGAGDCTEHAVLAAALARSLRRPARVVLGVLLVVAPDAVQGYGHAWAEVHDGSAWRIVDATPVAQVASARHLPLLALEEEGPGYALSLTLAMQRTMPRRVEVSGAP